MSDDDVLDYTDQVLNAITAHLSDRGVPIEELPRLHALLVAGAALASSTYLDSGSLRGGIKGSPEILLRYMYPDYDGYPATAARFGMKLAETGDVPGSVKYALNLLVAPTNGPDDAPIRDMAYRLYERYSADRYKA